MLAGEKSVPQRLLKPSSAAIYGTAEAVPFVGQSLPTGFSGAVQIAQPKKSNLDKSETN
jgi:hypothetical protein